MNINTANLLNIVKGDSDLLLCDSREVAMHLGIEHHSIMKTIRNHKSHIAQHFEVVRFQVDKPLKGTTGGRPNEYALLTEMQATFIVTLSRNTPHVVEFKATLVKSFYTARQALMGVSLNLGQVAKPSQSNQSNQSVKSLDMDSLFGDSEPSVHDILDTALLRKANSICPHRLDSVESVESLYSLYCRYLEARLAIATFCE